MSEMALQPEAPTQPPIERATDIACINCGYRLRGLCLDDTCPECGAPVRDSARGMGLADAPEAWRDALGRGAQWMERAAKGFLWGVYPGVILAAVAARHLTVKRPDVKERKIEREVRWLARGLLWIGVLSPLTLFVGLYLQTTVYYRSNLVAISDGVTIGVHSCFALGLFMLGDHMGRIAKTAQDQPLQRMSVTVRTRTLWLLCMVAVGGGWARGSRAFFWWTHLTPLRVAGILAVVAVVFAITVWWIRGVMRWARLVADRLDESQE